MLILLRAKFKIFFRTRTSNKGKKAASTKGTSTNQRNEVAPTPTPALAPTPTPAPAQQPAPTPATASTNTAPTMRTIFKILLHEGEKNLTETRRIRTLSEQIEKRIQKNNNLIRRCKDMNQEAYMKLLTRQADKEIEALHNELEDIIKNLNNMTNIQYYKQKKIDLEEGIKIQTDLKQSYQTVITTLTKQKSMSKTNMKTTHETQRSVLETIMEDSNTTTMSVDITNTSIATTSIAAGQYLSTINMNITPDDLIGNVANITTTDVSKNVTTRNDEMTNDAITPIINNKHLHS